MEKDHSTNKTVQISPLVLADQMITLAQEADRAGYRVAASRLVGLAYAVLEPRAAASTRADRAAS